MGYWGPRRGIECIKPGGLLRSEYSGASQDLRCRAMLVAQMSRPMHCSSVLRGTRRFPSSALIKASSLVSLADTS